jgi:hypothetical protein
LPRDVGLTSRGNYSGIVVDDSNNFIGGTSANEANVISGNTGAGVDIQGTGTTGNQVQGNLIGTDSAGTAMIANQTGVLIESGAVSNLVGGNSMPADGSLAGAGNVISGNTGSGVQSLTPRATCWSTTRRASAWRARWMHRDKPTITPSTPRGTPRP